MRYHKNQKIYSAKVSYCQISDIRIIFRQDSDFGIIKYYTVVRDRSKTSATSINRDILSNS